MEEVEFVYGYLSPENREKYGKYLEETVIT